ncbi:MAG: hypothetical protein KBG28_28625 [Kofleriaceae bacterium]|nr:hypothetical protein [Kofleriaceae bacterium]
MSADEHARLANSVLRVLNRIPTRPNLVMSFVDSEGITAKARLRPHEVVIEFGTANVLLVRDLSASIMSLPNTFQDIGDCAREDGARVPRRARFPVSLRDMLAVEGDYNFCAPICPMRASYVSGLVELALHGIMFHELAHILLGHLHVLERHEVPTLGKLAMEWSADAYAASLLAMSFSDKSLGGMDMVFRAFLFTSSMDYEMWQFGPVDSGNERVHPLPHHRILSAAASIQQVGARRGLRWEPKGSDLTDLIVAHRHITGSAVNVAYIEESFKKPDVQLLEYWQREIRPLAQEYALVPLLTTGPYDDYFYR